MAMVTRTEVDQHIKEALAWLEGSGSGPGAAAPVGAAQVHASIAAAQASLLVLNELHNLRRTGLWQRNG
jgi:hypothetical protein